MIIKYNSLDNMYYLSDLGDGSGTFIQVIQPK